jgi:hypothetical protein
MLATIGVEAMNFVRACETIHALLATGDTLTRDDRGLIVFSGRELLTKLKAA